MPSVCLPNFIILHLVILEIMAKSRNYEAPHYDIFSRLLLVHAF
jgi:hypothetical protein